MYISYLDSPVGTLTLASDGVSLTGLWLEGQKYYGATLPKCPREKPDLPVFKETERWLQAYFAGGPVPSLPPLDPNGTPFRKAVWTLLLSIPKGSVRTYGEIADDLRSRGIRASAQAVGNAVGHNPVSILIPCHRVLGSDGSLTGYAGGLDKKRFLLKLEGAAVK